MCAETLESRGSDDPTRIEQLQQMLQVQTAVLQSALYGIAITDTSGRILWINPAFEQMTGYSNLEAVGQSFRLLKSGYQDQTLYKNLWETILSGKVWQGELINRRKDGSLFFENLTITPVKGEDGEVTHFVALMQDVSTSKQREMQLEAVFTMANTLRAAANRAEMVPLLLEQTMHLLHATGAAIAFPDPSAEEIYLELGLGDLQGWTGLQVPRGSGQTSRVIDTGLPIVTSGDQLDTGFAAKGTIPSTISVVCVPLISQEQTVGALWLTCELRFEEESIRLLNAVTDIAANAIFRANLQVQTEQHAQRLSALRIIDEAISSSLDLSVTLGVLLDQVIWQLGVDAADVLLLNPHKETLEYAAMRGFHSREFPYRRIKVGEGVAGKAVATQQTIHIPDLNQSDQQHSRMDLLRGEGFVTHIAVPLIAKGVVKGVLDIFNRKMLSPDQDWLSFLEAMTRQAAIAIDNSLLFEDLQRSNLEITNAYTATLEGWVRTLGLRDEETEGHTQRVTDITMRLAKAVGVVEPELEYFRRGALLHDIGKMGIPDNILKKSGPLTEEERSIIRMHPVYAYELLVPIPYLRSAIDIPYCHHEKWDGSGYPRGLKGEEIPLSARLFSVADVWDALRSDRPYRSSWPKERAVQYLRDEAGRHFDPRIVEIFFQAGIE